MRPRTLGGMEQKRWPLAWRPTAAHRFTAPPCAAGAPALAMASLGHGAKPLKGSRWMVLDIMVAAPAFPLQWHANFHQKGLQRLYIKRQ